MTGMPAPLDVEIADRRTAPSTLRSRRSAPPAGTFRALPTPADPPAEP